MKYVAGIVATIFAAVMSQGQLPAPQGQAEIPAFHSAPPSKTETLPPVMTQAQLAQAGFTVPAQKEAYKAAAKDSALMYQMPCYCFCDRHAGHKSLHSCFEGTHGAICETCMAEALYVHQQAKKGWSAKMIRDGIMRKDYQMVDLQNPQPVM
jgi:hypothetical protein